MLLYVLLKMQKMLMIFHIEKHQNILEVTKHLYLCIVFTTVRNLQRSRTLNQLISVLLLYPTISVLL